MAEQDEQPEEGVDADAGAAVAGERLAAARRDKKISIVEIAKELHLDETKVRALERNEFDALGAAVFAKGHLRKYAEIVDVEIEDVMTDYYQLTRGETAPPIVAGRGRQRQELSPGPWIVAGIVIVVLAAAYWWFGSRTPASTPATNPPAQALPQESAADAGPDVSDPVDSESADSQPAATASTPESGSVDPADEAAAPVDTGGVTDAADVAEDDVAARPADDSPEPVRISIAFSGDCWTEISDANGRRLYFGMGRDGQSVDLAGPAPVSVLFGNGANVSLFVDGEAYSLPPVDPSNQTVRLSLAKPR